MDEDQVEKPFRVSGDELVLKIKVIPKAGANRIDGVRAGEMLVRLRAPALKGEANRALVKYLAGLLRIARSEIRLLSGEHSRHKRLGLPGRTQSVLEEWL